jgi:hypothetical protein
MDIRLSDDDIFRHKEKCLNDSRSRKATDDDWESDYRMEVLEIDIGGMQI